jgi:hypothetical protein
MRQDIESPFVRSRYTSPGTIEKRENGEKQAQNEQNASPMPWCDSLVHLSLPPINDFALFTTTTTATCFSAQAVT